MLSEPEGLAAAYEHFGVWARGLPPWDEETLSRVQTLVLDCLSRDASRLPAGTVARILKPGRSRYEHHCKGPITGKSSKTKIVIYMRHHLVRGETPGFNKPRRQQTGT